MSMMLMVAALNTKVGNPLRKLVLIKLADNASDVGECWPSYQHIADQCEISKRSVMNHVEALCVAGLLRKEMRAGPKGNSSNIYFLTLGGAANSLGGANAAPPGAGDSLGSAGAAPGGSAGAAPRTSHSFEPVKEPVKEPKAKQVSQLDISSFPEQPSADVWTDYIGHRKAKKAPLNQTIVNQIGKELALAVVAGWSVDDALAEAMAAGWQGLKSQWLENRVKPNALRQTGGSGGFNKQTQLEARNAQAAAEFVDDIEGCYP
jgi:hypothetical protein